MTLNYFIISSLGGIDLVFACYTPSVALCAKALLCVCNEKESRVRVQPGLACFLWHCTACSSLCIIENY